MNAWRLKNGVVTQILQEEMILLDTLGGQYFDLNPSGTLMLDRVLNGASPASAARAVAERYEVSEARARQDLDQLLQQLSALGLIEAFDGETDASAAVNRLTALATSPREGSVK